jgi:hypothetical protein
VRERGVLVRHRDEDSVDVWRRRQTRHDDVEVIRRSFKGFFE